MCLYCVRCLVSPVRYGLLPSVTRLQASVVDGREGYRELEKGSRLYSNYC